MAEPQNYTLGRGELHFAKFKPGTKIPGGERYIGNSPEWNATIESESLDHYNSDRGIKEKDESITLSANRTASFVTDNVNPANIALFFLGSASVITATAQDVTDEVISGVEKGLTYQLGITASNPVGVRGLDVHTTGPETKNIVVKNASGDEFEEGLEGDYLIDMELGRLTINPEGSITEGSEILVSYKVQAGSFERVISGNQPVEGALRYISYNPAGKQFDWYMPWVKLSPNGDYALKGDEWQQIPFSVEILRQPGKEAIYVDGRPMAKKP